MKYYSIIVCAWFSIIACAWFLTSSASSLLIQGDTFKMQKEGDRYAIYLSNKIEGTNKYTNLIMWVNRNKHLKNVDVYLAGFGGKVSSTVLLIQAMRKSPTEYRAVIYGNVYSGHAFLAVNLDAVAYTDRNILLMFHGPGINDPWSGDVLTPKEHCHTLDGTNRGIDKKTKCLREIKPHRKAFYEAAEKRVKEILTPAEWQYYTKGRDIYIEAGRINQLENVYE